jgi:hypothetical protein
VNLIKSEKKVRSILILTLDSLCQVKSLSVSVPFKDIMRATKSTRTFAVLKLHQLLMLLTLITVHPKIAIKISQTLMNSCRSMTTRGMSPFKECRLHTIKKMFRLKRKDKMSPALI